MIGLDIDGRNRGDATFNMLKAYFNLRYLFPRGKVKVSITRHGYHVESFGPCFPFEKEIVIRSMLGDDRTRIKLDEYKKTIGSHNYNVLWTEKDGFNVHEVKPI